MDCPVTSLWVSGAQPGAWHRIFVLRVAQRPDLEIPQFDRFLHYPTLACWHFAEVHPTKIVSPNFVHAPLESPPNGSWAETVVRGARWTDWRGSDRWIYQQEILTPTPSR